jgi:hypothetical protein
MTDRTTHRDEPTAAYPAHDPTTETTRHPAVSEDDQRHGIFGGASTDRRSDEDDRTAREHHDDWRDDGHERFGGVNLGAAFFGWLVAIAMTVLLAGIVGALATAVGETLDLTQTEAEAEADTIGLAAGVALLLVLMIGYFAGGYVSGRMSRFDGGRQGWGVWLIGLIVTAVVAVTGWIFGNEYDIFERVDLPSIPLSDDTVTVGGIVLAASIVVGTLLAAMAGGKAGLRYHHKVDRHTTTI